jgi:hypothetical protein
MQRAISRMKSEPVSVPLTLKGRPLLVLLPKDQRNLTIVKQVLPEVIDIFGDTSITLLAFPGGEVQSIFPTKGIRIISPPPSVLSWQKLPARSFLELLRRDKYEYIFDTNLEENRFAARILLEFPKAVRFGCSERLGAPYLNLEIKTKYTRDRRLIYSSILEVIAALGKSGQRGRAVSEEHLCISNS